MNYKTISLKKLITVLFICSLFIIQPTIFSQSTPDKRTQDDQISLLHKTNIFTNKLTINAPRCSAPAFAELNEEITITVYGTLSSPYYVYLSTAYEPVVDDIWLPVQTVETSGDNTHLITVSIPSGTPIELYNLTVLIEERGMYKKIIEPRAVQVIDSFKESFSFIHITDFHVGDPRGFLESIRETIGWKSIKRCITEINLLQPDFVVISGDLTYGQLYPFEYHREYEICYDIIQQFDVPTFLVPGNHDGYNRILEDGLSYWERYFGPLYYSFEYGDYHFQAINSYDMSKFHRFTFFFIPLNWGGSISDEQLLWIDHDLKHHNGKHHVQFMHHNPLWDTKQDSLMRKDFENREQLLSIINEYNVDLVLAGHVHYDSVTLENDTLFITTTTPESEIRVQDGYWGYRLIEIEDGTIAHYNYKEPKYSIPSYQLESTKWSEGRLAKADITNELECDITAYVEFVLPAGSYHVSQGQLLQQRTKEDITQLYVKTTVSANDEKTVFISSVQ